MPCAGDAPCYPANPPLSTRMATPAAWHGVLPRLEASGRLNLERLLISIERRRCPSNPGATLSPPTLKSARTRAPQRPPSVLSCAARDRAVARGWRLHSLLARSSSLPSIHQGATRTTGRTPAASCCLQGLPTPAPRYHGTHSYNDGLLYAARSARCESVDRRPERWCDRGIGNGAKHDRWLY